MPPKKRQQPNLPKRRQSKRMRPSDLTETAPETEHASLAAANSNTANLMTVDVNALTSSISLAVTEAVQRAFEKIPQTQVDKCQDKPTGVEAVVDEEVSLLTESTPPSTSSNPLPLPSNRKPFASIAVALGSHVTPKLKRKIWANEYIDFGALLSVSPATEKYSLSFKSTDSSPRQPQLTLEPFQPSKKIHSFNQWLSAFNTFVAIFTEKFPHEAPQLMKYCEIIRDISAKPGDWYFYDEQFRYLRQSAPDQYPWDAVHWELWLKAVINFRTKSQFSSDKVNSGVPTRSRPRQSFPKGSCWTFHAGRYCAGCRFDHVCFKCGAKHPASQCSATQQHRLPFSKEGPVATNSTQQSGHSRKGGQA